MYDIDIRNYISSPITKPYVGRRCKSRGGLLSDAENSTSTCPHYRAGPGDPRPANFAGILTKSPTRSFSQSHTIRIEKVRGYFGFCPLPRPSVFDCPSTGINAVLLTFFLILKETLFTDSFQFRLFRTEKESVLLPSSMLVISLRFNKKFRNPFVNV